MDSNKIRESLILRGLCSAIQQMNLPTFQNLIDLMKQVGYKVNINKE
jgi:hypothetical protein